jgi:hypothetical protein
MLLTLKLLLKNTMPFTSNVAPGELVLTPNLFELRFHMSNVGSWVTMPELLTTGIELAVDRFSPPPTSVLFPAGKVILPPPVAGAKTVDPPLLDPGMKIPGSQAGQVSAVTALAFVPSHLNSWREQVLNCVATVPAPSTLVGQTKVLPPVPSWQMLNQISWPTVALPVDSVEEVTFPVRVMRNPCGLDADTVNVGVAENDVVV